MALASTHVRFAADLKDDFEVSDVEAYISGTLYPDSRSLTKTSRSLTHPPGYLEKEFLTSDFKKGWAAHCLCDEIQKEIVTRYFPEIKNARDRDELWIKFSAIKSVAAICDFQVFDIEPYLKYFKFINGPLNENARELSVYYAAMEKTFERKMKLSAEDVREMWAAGIGLEKQLVDKLIGATENILKDAAMTKKISEFYGEMMTSYRNAKT